ncbi:putative membrane protein [Escherichia coli DEC13E]|nr:putative membrane protein [Escherichia coli DEC13E]
MQRIILSISASVIVMASVVMENNAVIVAGPSWKMKHRG